MATVYELTAAAARMVALWQDGEMTDEELAVNLDSFLDAAGDKLSALRAVVIRAEAEADLLKREAALLTDRRKRAESVVERCTARAGDLLAAMRDAGQAPKVPGVVSLATNGGKLPVVVTDPELIPIRFQRVQVTPDTDKIRAALEAGADVPGCALGERGESVRWARGGGK